MKTEIVEFEIEDEKGTKVKHQVTLKELDFGESNAMEEEATDVKIVGTQPIVKVSTSKMKEVGLIKSIVNSTIPIKGIPDIQRLPKKVGNKLFEVFTKLNQQDLKQDT